MRSFDLAVVRVKRMLHKAAFIQSLFRTPPRVGSKGNDMPSLFSSQKSTIVHLYLKMERFFNISGGLLSLSVPESHTRCKSDLAQQATAVSTTPAGPRS